MAWTTLSTVEELHEDVPTLEAAGVSIVKLDKVISSAQDVVYDDLSKYVDWDNIEALTAVPRTINRLARYQAAMIAIDRNWSDDDTMLGDGTEAQNNLYDLKERQYDKLLAQIKSGDILILDGNNDELEADEVRFTGPGRVI